MSGRFRQLFTAKFAKGVFSNFFVKNSGIVLTGSVAFYTLLSMIPLIGLLLVGLSVVVDVATLSRVVAAQLKLMVPGGAPRVMTEVQSFVEHRKLAGGVGVLGILFFGSQAFSTLERSMAIIFHKRRERVRRHAVTSLLIPYLYIAALGAGLLMLTGMTAFLEWAGARAISAGGRTFDLSGTTAFTVSTLQFFTEVLLFGSLYVVFPGGRVKWHHAMLGGAFAALLWEGTRRLLVWYYTSTSLSVVSVVYGSLANTFVALLSMEAAALIVLFSAQILADYEALDAPPRPPPTVLRPAMSIDQSVEEPLILKPPK